MTAMSSHYGDHRSGDSVADVVLTYLLLPLGAVAAVASSLMWLAGQLAAYVTGNGWPDVSWTTGWQMLLSPDDPAAAWPRRLQELAGPVWLVWTLVALEVLVLAALVVGEAGSGIAAILAKTATIAVAQGQVSGIWSRRRLAE